MLKKFSTLVLALFLFIAMSPGITAFAQTSIWDFSNPSDYTYDTSIIDVAGGKAQLRPAATPTWYSSSWLHREKITFNNSAGAENLVNFPILVKLTSAIVDYSRIQDAGQDLRFTDSDGVTLLPYEIEKWDETGTSSVWVKVPQIDASSSADFIYVYYDNAAALDAQTPTSVWDSNFVDVQHLKNPPVQSLQTVGGFGAVGEGSAISGNYLYVSNATNAIVSKINLTTFTTESELNLGSGYTESMSTDNTYLYVGFNQAPAKIARIRLSDFTLVDMMTLGTGEDIPTGMHIVGTNLYVGLWVSPGKVAKIDLLTFTKTAVLTLSTGENHAEEASDDGTYLYIPCELSGHVIKIRLSDFTEVTSIQLLSNMNEPQQTVVYGGYVYVITRQTSNSANPGKLIRIPVNDFRIESATYIRTIKEGNGLIVGDDGYLYAGNYSRDEPAVVKIDPNTFTETAFLNIGGAGHGEGVVAANGYLYAMTNAVGNGSMVVKKINMATDFISDIKDSTSFNNSGRTSASMDVSDSVAAKIGNGLNLDGTTDYVNAADTPSLSFGSGDFTISVWAKRTVDYTSDSTPSELIEKEYPNTPYYQIGIVPNSNLPLFGIRGVNVRSVAATTPISNSAFTNITAVFKNGESMKIYINGALEGTTSFATSEVTDSPATLMFGRGSAGFFGGVLDEIRLSNSARSAAWVAASYKSENNTLNSFGSQENQAFSTANPTIKPISSQSFSSISGFTEGVTRNGGEVKYQISNDGGTTWYWYNSGWTPTVTGYAEASLGDDINTHISSFPTGSGQFLWRAYYHSDGTQIVQIDSTVLTYQNGDVVSVPSGGGGGGGGGWMGPITVAVPVAAVLPLSPGCTGGNLFNPSTGASCGSSVSTPSATTNTNTTANTSTASAKPTYDFGPAVLKLGSKGEGVKELQRFLNKNFNLGLVLDGQLGPKTIDVIKKWQKANGLTPDGLIGPKTKAKMEGK